MDLDGCLDPETGEVEPWALEIVEQLDSYTEISPSGTGLHILVRAGLPEGGNRKGQIEMYDRSRFFTVTGRRLEGTSHLIEERQTQIKALRARLFPMCQQKPPAANEAAVSANEISDEEILRRATTATNGERFARLWSRDRSGYTSDSEADLALCSMLAFWTGPDEDRIASLVTRSGLAREKWTRKDYRHCTIARVLNGAIEFYETAKKGAEPSRNGYSRGATSTPERLATSPAEPEAVGFPVDTMLASCRPLINEAIAALGPGCQGSQETRLRAPTRARQRVRRGERRVEA